jgi:beta-N-acetylhexosaminidase
MTFPPKGLDRPIPRRDLLRAVVPGFMFLVAACLPTRSPAPSGSSPTPSGFASPVPTPPASPSTTPAPTASPATSGRTLREKIARMVITGFRGLTVDEAPWIAEAIGVQGLGGVVLFAQDEQTGNLRNVGSPAQVAQLVDELRALAPDRQLIVAIDQEGGVVTRLSPEHGFPAVLSEAAIGASDRDAVRAWADGLASTLASVGINLNLAPVVDLDVNPDNPAIGALGRAFSADPEVVARDAAIEIRAHHRRGVRTALKHFPGLGSASVNTDDGVADVTTTWTRAELVPYQVLLADGLVDVVMAAHVQNGQLDAALPASLSAPTVDGLLRGELGFDGVVITDDLHAAAIRDTVGFEEAVPLAIEAGNDLLLAANQQVHEITVVEKIIGLVEGAIESGRLTEARIDASVARIERLFPSTTASA